MTSYTAIPDNAIDQDSPLTEDLGTLFRDNPIAGFEGSTDAPVAATGWHPYDMTNVGDGGDGEFYDFASDGASASIETPAFADGYEYAIRIEDYSNTTNSNFQIEIQLAATSGWSVFSANLITAPQQYRGIFAFTMPRLAAYAHSGQWLVPLCASSGGTAASGIEASSIGATASKIAKARVSMASGTNDSGKLFLLRRREFVTG
jgi:hypothetical protein